MLSDKQAFWLYRHRVTLACVFATVICLVVVLPIVAFIYWIFGGEFHRGASFGIYIIFNLYILIEVFRIVLKKHQDMSEKARQEDELLNLK